MLAESALLSGSVDCNRSKEGSQVTYVDVSPGRGTALFDLTGYYLMRLFQVQWPTTVKEAE